MTLVLSALGTMERATQGERSLLENSIQYLEAHARADIACSLRALQRSAPDLSSYIITCPHGAVWCGLCITDRAAWYGAQK